MRNETPDWDPPDAPAWKPEPRINDAPTDDEFVRIAKEVGELVSQKNKAYGDAFDKSEEFLFLVYPDEIIPAQYSDMLALIRIFDKMMRIATDKDAFGEDPARDIMGYGLLMARYHDRLKKNR